MTLPVNSYRAFSKGLKWAVTNDAYSYSLQKCMNHLNITNPDGLLNPQEIPEVIQDQIIEYMITLTNQSHSQRYAARTIFA